MPMKWSGWLAPLGAVAIGVMPLAGEGHGPTRQRRVLRPAWR
ncbi:hypothetical protein [Rhizobacter sp. SG703]|nr:hypothetical protein [Rhizobacter sp. SG703]NKI97810.1 hypothetical protein [Rhizobacter sp. SG703]